MDKPKSSTELIKEMAKSKELYQKFADSQIYTPNEKPTTFFMAGSPGAGKTESSIRFINNLNKEIGLNVVRIDADEIRKLFPDYNGQNAHLFQEAATLGVNKIYDYANKKKYNILLDGTFSIEKYAFININTALKYSREVYVLYIFQDPKIAWEFTLKREKLENRKITLDRFISAFLDAKTNVDKVKEKYGKNIKVNLIEKDFENNTEKIQFNITCIDNYINFNYTSQSLYDILKEVKI